MLLCHVVGLLTSRGHSQSLVPELLKDPQCKQHNVPILSADRKKSWLRVKNGYPKWNPGKWKHGLKPAVPWWFNFDPHPAATIRHHPALRGQARTFLAGGLAIDVVQR